MQAAKTTSENGVPTGRSSVQRAGRPRRMTKPRKMWAYVATDGALHLYTSQRKARGVWAEQGPTKRIRQVYVQWPTVKSEGSPPSRFETKQERNGDSLH